MHWTFILTGAFAMVALAAPTQAASQCAPPPGVVGIALPSELPPALREATSDLAMPGEPFDTIDVYVKGHKHGRYMFVWKAGEQWIVAAEHGGIALLYSVSVYGPSKDGKLVTLIDQRRNIRSSVCSTATELAKRFR